MSALHRDGTAQGLKSLQAQLDTFAKGTKATDVLHDYQLMNLVDHVVDTKGGTVTGISKSRVTTKSLDAALNLANPTAYDKAGAAANGADYVLLKQNGKSLRSVGFLGGKTVPAGGGDAGTVSVPAAGDSDSAGANVHNWYVSLVGIDKAGKKVLVASRNGLLHLVDGQATGGLQVLPDGRGGHRARRSRRPGRGRRRLRRLLAGGERRQAAGWLIGRPRVISEASGAGQ